MVVESKTNFGLSPLAGGDVSSKFRSPLPLPKRVPIFPQKSYGLDFSYSNKGSVRSACTTCFPFPKESTSEHYVDVLQFSNFGGMPTPLCPGVRPPKPWFADIRYSLAMPLPYTYPSVGHDVLNSQRVASAIERQIEAGCNLSIHELKRKARHFFTAMRASLSRVICKICGYILFKVFRRVMSQLLVSPEQVKRLQEANDTGLPLVYLPLHKSHLDYLMITWIAWHFHLPLPHIASGDNLNLSGFGWLLRATGAFFIRRRTDPNDETGKDIIYRAVLHSYIEKLMECGLPIEFFLEGTRSRFGKSLIPKNGLISNVVEAYQQGMIQDCYFVPVSYTYEDIAEGIFLEELMGVPKVRESVFGAFRGILKGFKKSQKCGAVRMHFGQPVLLSDYISSLSQILCGRSPQRALGRIPHSFSYRELVPWHHEHENRGDNRTLIRAIGYHIVYEAQSIVSISLPSVVSTLLLCKYTKGTTDVVLASDIEWFCNQIILSGSDVMGWNDNETSGLIALQHALKYIRSSVDIHDNFIEPRCSHRHLMHLAYYKNALVPLFAIKSAISLVLVSQKIQSVKVRDLIQEVMLICEWMQFEVIFSKACVPLHECVRHQLMKLSALGGPLVLHRDENADEFAENTACSDSSSISIRDINASYMLVFYSNFLRPFLQSLYMISEKLSQGETVEKESQFIRTTCREYLANANKQPFEVNHIFSVEAINSDSFKNSLQSLREKKIISTDPLDIRVIDAYQLAFLKTSLFTRLQVFI